LRILEAVKTARVGFPPRSKETRLPAFPQSFWWLTTKAIAPILSLKVIRPQWKKLPDPQQAGNLLQNSPLVTVL